MAKLKNVVRTGWEFIAQQEAATSGTVNAGDLVEESGGNVQSHSTDAGTLDTPTFAKDMRPRGYEAGDEYPEGDLITYLKCNAGALLTARLADGENVSEGDRLVSAGDGTLRAFDSANDDAAAVVATADEDLDNSGGGSTALLKIEVTA